MATKHQGAYHFLDVGGEKYGECVLVEFGEVRILIDGSHVRDYEGQPGYDSIPEQLESIYGHKAPFDLSLVVVTHCHNDHVGCLPELLRNDVIRPKWALITDQHLGFGRSDDDSDASTRPDLADERVRRLAAVLREEDASDLSDAELRQFIDDAVKVETRYAEFINTLKRKKVKIVQYRGQAIPQALSTLLAPTGFTLFGPSKDQLLYCAQQIADTNKDAVDAVQDLLNRDATLDDVALYRAIVQRDTDSPDGIRNPRGNGMNCQSITLGFGPKGARALLAGDMQFTEPGVRGAEDEVEQLRDTVVKAGPYTVFKTTHHTSHNGQDDAFLDALGNPPIVVHSGGLRDPSHPYPGLLKVLKKREGFKFARTDRNGLITVRPAAKTLAERIEIGKGRLNDFTDNAKDEEARQPLAIVGPSAAGAMRIFVLDVPPDVSQLTVGGMEIAIRRSAAPPNPEQPVIVTTDPTRRALQPARLPATAASDVNLAAGRELPSLLFVTNPARLATNVGQSETAAVLNAIRSKGHPVCEVPNDVDSALRRVVTMLRGDDSIRGIVIVGGYDVVPSVVLDVLPADVRKSLGTLVQDDGDEFIVWSDEPYGDIDGDRFAELPVSRVPDARDAKAFLSAVQADGIGDPGRFGIRNVARPFADGIWKGLAGNGALNISEHFTHDKIKPASVRPSCHYFMLHGEWQDATAFHGEHTRKAGYPLAFGVSNVPKTFRGAVFSGCCWGALVVSQRAAESNGSPIAPRVPERSIALSYLKAGAIAFIGCTGSHYSGPALDPLENYALAFHDAFWRGMRKEDYRPALALHGARNEFGRFIGANAASWDALQLARRLKNRAQFTCLGLGW